MNIEFENAALEELYSNGATKDHQYKRLSKDIVKGYTACTFIAHLTKLELL